MTYVVFKSNIFLYNKFGGVNYVFIIIFLCGLIVSTMNIFNGQLSAHCGVYLATVIIHLIGLITFTLIMFLKKQEISFKHHLPFILYTGGVIGVLTVILILSLSIILVQLC